MFPINRPDGYCVLSIKTANVSHILNWNWNFSENLWEPLTLKSAKKRIDGKKKLLQRRGRKAKRQFLPRNTKQILPESSWHPKSNVLFKMVLIGRNTLPKQMSSITSNTSLDGKFTNSSCPAQNSDPSAAWRFRPTRNLRADWPRQCGIHIQLQPY